MNLQNAVIIKTTSDEQTVRAKRMREVFSNQEFVLVPHGVQYLMISIEREELIVLLQRDDEVVGVVDLDVAKGFDSVAECKEYCELVIKEARLPEDSYDQDVWDCEGSTELHEENTYILNRDHESFYKEFDGFIHDISIPGRAVKKFDNQPLGCYTVTVGKKD